MKQSIKFGIIGGNGVLTTNALLDIITKKVIKLGAIVNWHHPEIILWKTPQSQAINLYVEDKINDFTPQYMEMINKLKGLGCNCFAIPCVSAHDRIGYLQQQTNSQIINLLQETALTLAGNYPEIQRVGMLCTNFTTNKKLFDPYLKKFLPDLEVIYPPAEYQAKITKAISNTNKGYSDLPPEDKENPYNYYLAVCDYFVAQNINTLIFGCVDININFIKQRLSKSLNVVTTMEVFSDVLIKIWLSQHKSYSKPFL